MDKALQNQILQLLKLRYPHDAYFPDINELKDAVKTQECQAALYYLSEHGLIELKYIRSVSQFNGQALGAKMTAKGIDYLAPDGGLTEYFNSVTVRFDAENIRQTIYEHISALDFNDKEKKQSILSSLKDFSVDTLRQVTQQAILEGLKNPHYLLQLIENLSRQGA